jgi:hypothetical protein
MGAVIFAGIQAAGKPTLLRLWAQGLLDGYRRQRKNQAGTSSSST